MDLHQEASVSPAEKSDKMHYFRRTRWTGTRGGYLYHVSTSARVTKQSSKARILIYRATGRTRSAWLNARITRYSSSLNSTNVETVSSPSTASTTVTPVSSPFSPSEFSVSSTSPTLLDIDITEWSSNEHGYSFTASSETPCPKNIRKSRGAAGSTISAEIPQDTTTALPLHKRLCKAYGSDCQHENGSAFQASRVIRFLESEVNKSSHPTFSTSTVSGSHMPDAKKRSAVNLLDALRCAIDDCSNQFSDQIADHHIGNVTTQDKDRQVSVSVEHQYQDTDLPTVWEAQHTTSGNLPHYVSSSQQILKWKPSEGIDTGKLRAYVAAGDLSYPPTFLNLPNDIHSLQEMVLTLLKECKKLRESHESYKKETTRTIERLQEEHEETMAKSRNFREQHDDDAQAQKNALKDMHKKDVEIEKLAMALGKMQDMLEHRTEMQEEIRMELEFCQKRLARYKRQKKPWRISSLDLATIPESPTKSSANEAEQMSIQPSQQLDQGPSPDIPVEKRRGLRRSLVATTKKGFEAMLAPLIRGGGKRQE